ncbi:ABC-three component system protein [Cellulosimicrobium arenosum]|uniref:ABC-three component systems C-terminal domain-containing protein n=1 Tax=Cellulosimicrobium arenosum TaxID=2708133 RepID=A0A927IZJ2_9MICO|nr:ABC-three component system protein [Cellulosimicrobium arenosum]MBD8078337.1 hypothetical protein [Cellulosimicrobium arenosum]
MSSGEHSAAASAAGYLYQVRWALLNLLREGRTRPDQVISLEMHDDVGWESASGTATELLQTKLHATETAGLGDYDPDIWKTLLIWLKRTDAMDPNGPDLALVTTSTARPGSAAFALRPGTRDEPTAADLLSTAAEASTNKKTEEGRRRFLKLSKLERTAFLCRVRVLDKSLPLEDLDEAVRQEIWGLPSGEKAQDRFLAELWRWWDNMSIDLLLGRRAGVAVSQLKVFVQELRDGYGPDSLRTTVLKSDVSEQDIVQHATGRFYDQMIAVRYNRPNLRLAVIDYYRALKQETEWVDDSLIGLHELQAFEENLRDEWARAFNDMLDDLSGGVGEYRSESVDDETKWRAGKELLRTLLESTKVTIRRHYDDPFFARGKRHELAHRDNELGIGWHPDFSDQLEDLVAVVVGGPAKV